MASGLSVFRKRRVLSNRNPLSSADSLRQPPRRVPEKLFTALETSGKSAGNHLFAGAGRDLYHGFRRPEAMAGGAPILAALWCGLVRTTGTAAYLINGSCEAQDIRLKAFGNWRAKFRAEPQRLQRKLLYRRGGLSQPLSHTLNHVTYPFSGRGSRCVATA
jgi:hypothetical protein